MHENATLSYCMKKCIRLWNVTCDVSCHIIPYHVIYMWCSMSYHIIDREIYIINCIFFRVGGYIGVSIVMSLICTATFVTLFCICARTGNIPLMSLLYAMTPQHSSDTPHRRDGSDRCELGEGVGPFMEVGGARWRSGDAAERFDWLRDVGVQPCAPIIWHSSWCSPAPSSGSPPAQRRESGEQRVREDTHLAQSFLHVGGETRTVTP